MKHSILSIGRSLAICLAIVFPVLTIHAADVVKADNANNLNDPASWVGGATPTSADVAVWDSTVTGANATLLGADTNWAGIRISSPGGAPTVNPNVSAAAVTATLNSPTFTYSAAPATPLVNGNRVFLSGTTAPTGFTFGTIYFVVNATATTFQLSATVGGAAISVGATTAGNAVTVTGGFSLMLGASGIDMSGAAQNLTLSGPDVGASQTWNVAADRTLTVSTPLTGSGTSVLTKTGNGTLTFSPPANGSFAGNVSLDGGVLVLNSANANNNSSIGTGMITNNGATLRAAAGRIIGNVLVFNGTCILDANNVSVPFDGAWSGSGTVLVTNLASGATLTAGNNGNGGGSWANFTGTVLLGGNLGNFRLNNGGGNGNLGNVGATLDLGTGTVTLTTRNRVGSTINFGTLSGGPNTRITIGSSGGSGTTYSVGALNVASTFAGTITGDTTANFLALTKVGNNVFKLTGTNTYVGPTTINAGTLQIGDGGTDGQLGSGIVVNNATLIFNRSDNISAGNVISGTGNLVQASPGVLTLTAANSYRGATIVTNGGTILVGAAGAIPTATVLTLGGAGTAGTLDMAGNDVQVSALNTGSGATGSTIGSSGGSIPTTFTVNATNGSSTFSGTIQDTLPGGSGVVALTVQNGQLTLTGANTYSGSTTISNGTLVLGAGGSISSSNIVLASSAAILDASAVGGFTLGSGYVLSGSGTVTGSVTAADSLINPATSGTAGTLTFGNNLTMSGGVSNHFDLSSTPAFGNDQIIVTGALNLSGLNTIEIAPMGPNLGLGTYKLIRYASLTGDTNNLQLVGSPGGVLTATLVATATELDLVVSVPDSAKYRWHGDGTANAWDYTTTNWTQNGSPALFTDGIYAYFDDTGSNSPAINLTTALSPALVTVDASASYTFSGSGNLTGGAGLVKNNSGTLTILTANNYTGPTLLNQGTIQVGNGATSGTLGNSLIIDNGALVFEQPDSNEITNSISGTGSLTQAGGGTLTLSGDNTYSGPTVISSGTLQVGDNSLASGSLGSGRVTNNATLIFNRPDSLVQNAGITGAGGVQQSGSGTTILAADNNYSGGTIINAGTLQLGNGGTNGSVAGAITDNGTLAFDRADDLTNSYAISGSGSVQKLGPNTLTFPGGNSYGGQTIVSAGLMFLTGSNGYFGDTVVSGGTLKLGAAGVIPSGPGYGNVVLDGGATAAGTLDLNGIDLTINGLSGAASNVLGRVVNNSGTATNVLTVGNGDASTAAYSGLILDNNNAGGGRIALVKIGAGTITLGATNSYTGGTVLSNGVLALGSNLANNASGMSGLGPTNSPVIFNGGTLQLFGYNGGTGPNYNTFYNPLVVPAGQSGTLQLFPRGPASGNPGLASPLTGSGTLNLVVNYVRDSLDGDWSAFTGLINVTAKTPGVDEFRINNRFGYANAAIFLNDGVRMDRASGANPTNDIGELGGTSGAIIGPGNSSSGSPTWRVGFKNTTATFAGTIQNDGTTSIIKVGGGTWILTGANTYAGSTTISNGVLALGDGVTDGSINNSTNINVVSGTVLDVSGRSDGTLTLNGGQTLSGNGIVRGTVTAGSGSTVSPGASIGLLTITNALNLQGGATTFMELDAAALTNDLIEVQGASGITYGGTLQLSLANGTLAAGQTYKLFNAPSYNGSSFGAVSPVSTNGLTWDTSNLAVNGTLTVIVAPKPVIDNITINGSDLNFSGNNGVAYASFNVLSSTDVTLPLSQWTVVTTSTFDGSGNFSFTLSGAFDPNQPQIFYAVQY